MNSPFHCTPLTLQILILANVWVYLKIAVKLVKKHKKGHMSNKKALDIMYESIKLFAVVSLLIKWWLKITCNSNPHLPAIK